MNEHKVKEKVRMAKLLFSLMREIVERKTLTLIITK